MRESSWWNGPWPRAGEGGWAPVLLDPEDRTSERVNGPNRKELESIVLFAGVEE